MSEIVRNLSKLQHIISDVLHPTAEQIAKSRSDIVSLCENFPWPVVTLGNYPYMQRTYTLYEDNSGIITLRIHSNKMYINVDIYPQMCEKLLEKHGFSLTDKPPPSVIKVLFFAEHIGEIVNKLDEVAKLMDKTSKDSEKLLEQIKEMSSVLSVFKVFS